MAFLLLAVGSVYAQNVRVSGQVLSADDDQPLIGATVRVLGTNIAGATDIDGKFTLTGVSPSDKQLEVSYIGYETKVVEIKPELVIHLQLHTEMMDEVMVVAFGKQKRESFTGAASVVSAADAQCRQRRPDLRHR